jgi:hypothetical protein
VGRFSTLLLLVAVAVVMGEAAVVVPAVTAVP